MVRNQHTPLIHRGIRRLALAAGLSWLSLGGSQLAAQSPTIIHRGLRDQQRFARTIGQAGQERRTHRGWEVYGDDFLVLANSSQDDARWAAAEFRTALSAARERWEKLTGELPPGNRARGALQITLDIDARLEAEPPPVIRRAGYAQSLYLSVAANQPAAASRAALLHDAAAVLLVDAQLSPTESPDWLREGLAGYLGAGRLANQKSVDETNQLIADFPELNPFEALVLRQGAAELFRQLQLDSVPRGRHPWRNPALAETLELARASFDNPTDAAKPVANEPTERVRFLLTGHDAQFAAPFATWLQSAVARSSEELATRRQDARTTPVAASEASQQLDAWWSDLEPQYARWKENPQVGRPAWEPLDKNDKNLVETQRRMALALRVLDKPRTSVASRVEPRVIELKGNVAGGRAGGLAPPRPLDLGQWVRAEAHRAERWAVVDESGDLLWNHDEERLAEALGLAERRYAAERRDSLLVLRQALSDGRTLEGWLEGEPNHHAPRLIKFAIRDSG